MAELDQPHRELRSALGRPPQRRLRITARPVLQQPPQILLDRRIRLTNRLLPSTRTADPPGLEQLTTLDLLMTPAHRRIPDTRRAHARRDPTTPLRTSLHRRPQPPTALV